MASPATLFFSLNLPLSTVITRSVKSKSDLPPCFSILLTSSRITLSTGESWNDSKSFPSSTSSPSGSPSFVCDQVISSPLCLTPAPVMPIDLIAVPAVFGLSSHLSSIPIVPLPITFKPSSLNLPLPSVILNVALVSSPSPSSNLISLLPSLSLFLK